MRRCWHQHGIVGNQWRHHFCGLLYSLLIAHLHLACQVLKLASVSVNGDKWGYAVTDVLFQGLVKDFGCAFCVASLGGFHIVCIALLQVLLHLLAWVYTIGKVSQHLIVNLLRVLVLDMQEVAHLLPEVLQGFADVVPDVAPLALV